MTLFLLLVWAQVDAARAEAVTAVLGRAQPGLHRCVEKVGAQDYQAAAGSVTLVVTVGEGGRTARIEARAPKGDPRLIKCATEVFRGLELGAPFVAGDSLELPLRFEGEPNVTVRAEDVPLVKVGGSSARGQVLINSASAMAGQAYLWRYVVERGGLLRLVVLNKMTLYVLAGEAALDGHKQLVVAGDVILGTARMGLDFRQRGQTPLEILAVTPPLPGGWFHARGALPRDKLPIIGVYSAGDKPEYPGPGGKGRVRVLMTRPLDLGVAVSQLALDPGAQVPEHAHAAEAEMLYVTRGAGTLRIDGEDVPVAAGMAVHVPPGSKHAFQVTSPEPFEAIQFYAPAGPERRFLPGATP